MSARHRPRPFLTSWIPVLAALPVASCGMSMDGHDMHDHLPAAPPMITPAPVPGDLTLPELTDESADPAIVEVHLTAAPAEVSYLPGTRTTVWAYNGRVPGPVLRAEVGNRVIIHFTNGLSEPTTVHWHGVRVPNAMDGVAAAAAAVPPGGSFTYDFVVPDAGTFWLHPHVRSEEQVEKGLYAPLVVTDPRAPALPVAADEVLVLGDVLVDPASGAPLGLHDARMEMMGVEGNLALVNGRAANVAIEVKAGEARRWRIVNAATARYLRLAVAGGHMVRVGGQAGLLEAPEAASELLLVPGARAEVVVWVDEPGATAILRALPHERAAGAGATAPLDLVRLTATGAAGGASPTLPERLRAPLPEPPAPGATRKIRLGESMGHGGLRFTINGAAYPLVPALTATAGQWESWEVVNESDMDHPFHLHGFFFRVAGGRELLDTVNVPVRSAVRLLVDFAARAGAGGAWMYHCHILGHAERGMMAEVNVQAPAGSGP